MDIKTAERAAKIIEEINGLSDYKNILEDREHGHVAHFEIRQHYGANCNSVDFDKKYNPKFIKVVEDIINELKQELSNL